MRLLRHSITIYGWSALVQLFNNLLIIRIGKFYMEYRKLDESMILLIMSNSSVYLVIFIINKLRSPFVYHSSLFRLSNVQHATPVISGVYTLS